MPSKRTSRAADAQPSQPASGDDAAQPTQRAVQASQAEASTGTPAIDSQAGGVLEAGQEVSTQFTPLFGLDRAKDEPWPSDGTRNEQMGPNEPGVAALPWTCPVCGGPTREAVCAVDGYRREQADAEARR